MMAFSASCKLGRGCRPSSVFNYSFRNLPNRGLIFKRNSKKKEKSVNEEEYNTNIDNDAQSIEAGDDGYSIHSSQTPDRKVKRLILKEGYTPPPDLVLRLRKIVEDTTNPAKYSNWQEAIIDDLDTKFKILMKCQQEFQLTVPDLKLSSINRVSDILRFYSQPIKEKKLFSRIDMDRLPPNLIIKAS